MTSALGCAWRSKSGGFWGGGLVMRTFGGDRRRPPVRHKGHGALAAAGAGYRSQQDAGYVCHVVSCNWRHVVGGSLGCCSRSWSRSVSVAVHNAYPKLISSFTAEIQMHIPVFLGTYSGWHKFPYTSKIVITNWKINNFHQNLTMLY